MPKKSSAYRFACGYLAPALSPLLSVFWLVSTFSSSSIRKTLRLFSHPIVIGGCARSGTTLLLSVLSCHPNIFALGDETYALCPNLGLPYSTFHIRKDRIIKHLVRGRLNGTEIHWCEKTPRNVLCYKELVQAFGTKISILNIVRDGRDVVTSRHPSDPELYYVSPHRWINSVRAGMSLEGHNQVLTIKYEDLVINFEESVQKICDFLQLDFVDEFLGYPDTARIYGSVEKAAWLKGRRPMNAASVGRHKKKKHQKRVQELLSEKNAVQLLKHYEYVLET